MAFLQVWFPGRENKMEVTLYRAEQEIPLELDATVLVEWNYEPISAEKYAAAI